MTANNYKKYDEDFKKSLVSLSIKTVKLKLSYVKNTASLNPPLPNGLNNIPLLNLIMVKFLPLSRSRNFKNVTLSLKKKTSY